MGAASGISHHRGLYNLLLPFITIAAISAVLPLFLPKKLPQFTRNTRTTGNRTGTPKEDVPSKSCRRTCPHYKNRIEIETNKAGLKDRTYQMQAWGNMAMFLCAHVVVPKPRNFLSPAHETLREIDRNMTFRNDLLYFVDANNESEVVVSDVVDHEEPSGGWGIQLMSGVETILQDFSTLHNYTVQQHHGAVGRPFQWKVRANFFHYRNKVLFHLQHLRNSEMAAANLERKQFPKFSRFRNDPGCVYVKKVEAATNVMTAQRVMHKIQGDIGGEEVPFVFGFLHVRRRDTTHVCNTELPKISRYLNCTFNAFCLHEMAESKHCKKRMPLLVGSDERSHTYRKGLFSLIDAQPGLRAVDLDALVEKEIEREIQAGEAPPTKRSNYNVFLVGKLIIQRASHYFQQHRSNCHDCDADLVFLGQNDGRKWWSSWLPMNIQDLPKLMSEASDGIPAAGG